MIIFVDVIREAKVTVLLRHMESERVIVTLVWLLAVLDLADLDQNFSPP